jgi:hypothetical protein
LELEERRRLEEHLETCPSCRSELVETRRIAQLFGVHPSAEMIVTLALEEEAGDPLARRHLEDCAECSEELRLARQGKHDVEAIAATSRSAPLALRISHAALAAALVITLGTAVSWRNEHQRAVLAVAELDAQAKQLAEARSETESLRERASGLQARVDALSAPETNMPIMELLPPELRRSVGTEEQRLVISPGVQTVALLLSTAVSVQGVSVVIHDSEATVLWEGHGLEPSPLGGYTLGLPAALLPEGLLTIALKVDNSARPIVRYRLRVQRSR